MVGSIRVGSKSVLSYKPLPLDDPGMGAAVEAMGQAARDVAGKAIEMRASDPKRANRDIVKLHNSEEESGKSGEKPKIAAPIGKLDNIG